MKYFHNIFFVIVFSFFFSEISSQKITVLDSTNGRPIPAVLVYDLDRSERKVSNRNGTIDLNVFKNSDSIVFTHIVFQRKVISILIRTVRQTIWPSIRLFYSFFLNPGQRCQPVAKRCGAFLLDSS